MVFPDIIRLIEELGEFIGQLGEMTWFFPICAVDGETRRVEGQLGELGQLGPPTLTLIYVFEQVCPKGYLMVI